MKANDMSSQPMNYMQDIIETYTSDIVLEDNFEIFQLANFRVVGYFGSQMVGEMSI